MHIERLLVICITVIRSITCNQDARRLFEDLLADYNKLVRPVSNNSQALIVKFKLRLSQLLDVVGVIRKKIFKQIFFV